MHGEDGHRTHRLFHRAGSIDAELMRRIQWAHHADARDADADIEKVDHAERLEAGAEYRRVIRREPVAVRHLLVADKAQANRHRRASRSTHRLQHLDREAHAVLQAAPILVRPLVAAR
jgi:hypothetical protein